MGVHGLWSVLSELCERKPLTYLVGKKVAVDLSGWVVQAIQCKGLNTSKSPHLRNLFFRVSRLLQLGVYPIFVIEGKPPSLKEAAIKERNGGRHPENHSSTTSISRKTFDRILKQCQDLLACLGVPCIKSSGEGEAFCAFLCLNGIVEGVITEDNDAFLYGADVIFRNFSIEPSDSHVNVYSLASKKNKQKLDRCKLVALALLLGCDYSKGVPGIGKETALKLLSELDCDDVLQRFKDWRKLSESELFPGLDKSVKRSTHCTRCEHLGSKIKHKKDGCSMCDSKITCYMPNPVNPCRCPWHINNELMIKRKTELKIYNSVKNCPDFPDMKVVDEYLNYTDQVPCDGNLDWKCPNLITFQEKALNFLGWTFEYSHEKVLPLITAWQQFKLRTNGDRTHFIYEPVKAIKERSKKDISYLEVQWKLIDNAGDNSFPAENLTTLEYFDQFSICYKEIVDEFKSELNEKKKSKNKGKKLKPVERNQKVNSESALESVGILNTQTIFSPKFSPFGDSFSSLLDVPLWERVNAMPKILFEIPKPVCDYTNEMLEISFNKESGTCVFSPVSLRFSDSSFELDKESSKGALKFASDEKISNGSSKTKTEIMTTFHPCDVRNKICLDFSDSDDSFLDVLLCKKDNSFQTDISQSQDVCMKISSPVTNSSKHELYNKHLDYVQVISSPLKKLRNMSPCLIYSVNQSPFSVSDRVCLNPLFSKIHNSTPILKGELLSKDSLGTPKSSKVLSNLIFSPLIFDSSLEDMPVL